MAEKVEKGVLAKRERSVTERIAAVGWGAFFIGVWQLIEMQVSLVPILLIAGGLAVILSTLWPRTWRRRHA